MLAILLLLRIWRAHIALLISVAVYLTGPKGHAWSVYLALFMVAAGLIYQLDRSVQHGVQVRYERRDMVQWSAVVRWLTNYAFEHRMESPVVSVDMVSDRLNALAIASGGFEQTGNLVKWQQLLGSSIFAADESQAMKWIAASDIVILTSLSKDVPYAFNNSVRVYWPALKKWADANLKLATAFDFDKGTVWIYTRPDHRD